MGGTSLDSEKADVPYRIYPSSRPRRQSSHHNHTFTSPTTSAPIKNASIHSCRAIESTMADMELVLCFGICNKTLEVAARAESAIDSNSGYCNGHLLPTEYPPHH